MIDIEALVDAKKAHRESLGPFFWVIVDKKSKLCPKDVVLIDGEIIYPYPSIGRFLYLQPGIKKHFRHPFWVEEKIDGYNIRLFKTAQGLFAMTRRGYFCPFTADRAFDFINPQFFVDHPHLILCLEVAGPQNPYLENYPADIDADVRLFVFDIMEKGKEGFLPFTEKRALIEHYRLPSVPVYGLFDAEKISNLKQLLLDLDGSGKEGIVMKESQAPFTRAKYVTERSSLQDMESASHYFLQLPPQYFTHRILRLALFMDEENLDVARQESTKRLGDILTQGLFSALRQFRQTGKVSNRFRCYFHQEENARLFLESRKKLLGHSHFVVSRLEKEADWFVLEFDKEYPRMTSLLQHYLSGGIVFD
jgi:putative ATP-dependent DNA ligase